MYSRVDFSDSTATNSPALTNSAESDFESEVGWCARLTRPTCVSGTTTEALRPCHGRITPSIHGSEGWIPRSGLRASIRSTEPQVTFLRASPPWILRRRKGEGGLSFAGRYSLPLGELHLGVACESAESRQGPATTQRPARGEGPENRRELMRFFRTQEGRSRMPRRATAG